MEDKRIGNYYGGWKLLELHPTHFIKQGKRHCKVLCTGCNNKMTRDWISVKGGHTRGCNSCARKRRYKDYRAYSGSRLHRIWLNMNNRCNNSKTRDYKWYGAKGIKLCDEWRSFLTFEQWALKNGYLDLDVEFKNQLSIDRIDNDKGYNPDNCQWLTVSENSRKQFIQSATTIPSGSTAQVNGAGSGVQSND